ncbi:hypothetical protein ALMP_51270 [Streptomyces sp. A012304]|nr:hypothetical protein ALMP_51270 [Streptomyces sp. A012304]
MQQFLEGVGQGVRSGQAFGEFVEGREIGHPAGETVLEEGSCGGRDRWGGWGGGRGRDSVCGRGKR